MSNDENAWRTPSFRQNIVNKIDEAVQQAGMPTTRNSRDMETHVFEKAKSREEYLGFVARLILHVREQAEKGRLMNSGGGVGGGNITSLGGNSQAMPDPINALQTLARQGTNAGGAQGGAAGGAPGGPQNNASTLLQTLNQRPNMQRMAMGPNVQGQMSGHMQGPMGGQMGQMGGQMQGQMSGQMPAQMAGQMGAPMGGQMGNQMGGQMGGQMAGQMGQLSNQMGNQMSSQMQGQLNGQMPGQMGGQMQVQISNQMQNQLPNQMGNQLSGQLGGQMPGQMGGQIPGQMSSQMAGQIPGQMSSQMSGQMPTQMGGQIGNQIGGPMQNQMSGQIGGQMPGNMGNQTSNQMMSQMAQQMAGQMGNQMHGQMGGQISQGGSGMGNQMASNLPGQMSNIQGQMGGGLGNQVPNQLSSEMHSQLVGQLNTSMQSQMPNAMHMQQRKAPDGMMLNQGANFVGPRNVTPNQFHRQSPTPNVQSPASIGAGPPSNQMAPSPVVGLALSPGSQLGPVPTQPRALGMAPSPGSAINTPGPAQPTPSPLAQPTAEEAAYRDKIRHLSKYIEPLRRMIAHMRLKRDDGEKMSKMKQLLDLLTNTSRRTQLETLNKCEIVLDKLDFARYIEQPPAASPSNVPAAAPIGSLKEHVLFRPLLEAMSATLKSNLANHTLQRTFVAPNQAFFGSEIKILPPPLKRKRVEEVPNDIPEVLQGEIARLDQRFKVSLDPTHQCGANAIQLLCWLDDRHLPCVPPVTVSVPDDYPMSPPRCIVGSHEYNATSFLVTVQTSLDARIKKLPVRYSVSQLLDTWEMSVRQASAPVHVTPSPTAVLLGL